jgi:hypothetical protein
MVQKERVEKSRRKSEEIFFLRRLNWGFSCWWHKSKELWLVRRHPTLHRQTQTATEHFNRFQIIVFQWKKLKNWTAAWHMSEYIEHLKVPRATFSDKLEADYQDIESCWAFHQTSLPVTAINFPFPLLVSFRSTRLCLFINSNISFSIQFSRLVSKSSSLTANICQIIIQWYVWDGKLITFLGSLCLLESC